MSKTVMEKMAERFRVKVIKPAPGSDDRNMLCGEPLQKGFNAEGEIEHFFDLPAHQADYINKAFRQYKVTEPFIPGVDEPTAILDKEFACQVEGCGKVFKRQQDLITHGKVAHK